MLEKLPTQVGRALRRARPGIRSLVYHSNAVAAAQPTIEVTSDAFTDRGSIPARYTDDGDGASPPLRWAHLPSRARSVAILVEDADSPTPAPLVHAIAWKLPPGDGELAEGALLPAERHPPLGLNSFFRPGWLPPDPPPGHGPHRYGFQIFALDNIPDLRGQPGRRALLGALRGHTIARGLLIGTYER